MQYNTVQCGDEASETIFAVPGVIYYVCTIQCNIVQCGDEASEIIFAVPGYVSVRQLEGGVQYNAI